MFFWQFWIFTVEILAYLSFKVWGFLETHTCNEGSNQNPRNFTSSASLGNFFVFLCFEVKISMKSIFFHINVLRYVTRPDIIWLQRLRPCSHFFIAMVSLVFCFYSSVHIWHFFIITLWKAWRLSWEQLYSGWMLFLLYVFNKLIFYAVCIY